MDPVALKHAADTVSAGKHSNDTVLLDDSHFAFEADGRLTESHHIIYRIENEAGVANWSEISGQWEAWHQQKPELRARVISPDGSVHWLDATTLSDVPVHEEAPDLYTDERRYGGPLPAVAPGAIVETEVILRDKSPLFAGGIVRRYTLAWGVPSNASQVEITHPESLPLRYQTHLLPDAATTKTEENGIETILLKQGPLPAYDNEPEDAPPDLVLYPQMEFSTGTSWEEVAAEYARLTAPKLRVGDVESLLAGLNLKNADRKTTIRRIVSALHKNVRYTGVEFGESSLIPQFPSETLQRRYGDCKDKASLLVAMLRGVGVPATLALLKTGPGRDINTELPGLGMFDHAIVYVPASDSDRELWIDATAQYSQVGTLPWMDYGRWALVIGENRSL